MSIKSQGGVFGRNPTFNDVEVDGTLTVGGNSVPDASTILVDGDIGSTVQGYDVDTAKYDDTTANFTGTLQNGGSNVVVDSDIGSTVQAYDADTAKLDANQTWTGTQAFNGAFVDVYKEAQGGYATFRAYGPSGQILWANGGTSTSYLDSDTIVFRKSFSSGNAEHARFNTSGNLAFPSGNGIDFSATSGTGTSELFSDYEEGNWTPVLESTGATFSYALQIGDYVKIGKLVYASFSINTGAGASGTVTNGIKITGLPFTANATYYGSFSNAWQNLSLVPVGIPVGTSIFLYAQGTVAQATPTTLGFTSASKYFSATLIYSV